MRLVLKNFKNGSTDAFWEWPISQVITLFKVEFNTQYQSKINNVGWFELQTDIHHNFALSLSSLSLLSPSFLFLTFSFSLCNHFQRALPVTKMTPPHDYTDYNNHSLIR